jgi:hypothetical protein
MRRDVGGTAESMEMVLLSPAPSVICGIESVLPEAGRVYEMLPIATVAAFSWGPKESVAV